MNESGIYKIINKVNNKFYLGSTKDFSVRFNTHKYNLRKNKHINCILQRAWNKYGESNFEFKIILICNSNILKEKEQIFLDEIRPLILNGKCYNIGLKSYGGDNISQHPDRENIIKKMTQSLLNRFRTMSVEKRKQIYCKPGSKNPNWKGGPKLCLCGKKIDKKSKTCENCLNRKGENNSFYGKHHTDKTKKTLRAKRLNTYNGSQNFPIIINDIEYRSAGEASKKLNIPMVTIRWRVQSKNIKFSNYNYKN